MSLLRPHGAPPAMLSWKLIGLAALGGAVAVGGIAFLSSLEHIPLILGSFGASSVILFGYPESPFAQPRAVIGGHFLSSLTGLMVLMLFGPTWWAMGLAVGAAIGLMHITRTVHPPAGSNPVIILSTAPAWSMLWTPTLAGAVLLVVVAFVFHALTRPKQWPRYWL